MSRVSVRALSCRSLFLTLSIALLAIGLPAAAGAQPRHARLSRDLSDRLAKGDPAGSSVIVTGTVPVETIAARYGARILRVLRRGAVLEVNGGQLDALSRDAEVDHLSGDVPVHRMAAETTAAIGADQVWRGVLSGSGKYNGAGIGIAVVDSGIAHAPSLNGRVLASVDFTGTKPKRADEYGHGTAVAGIIASTSASYPGVAPGASLVNLRALGSDGSGATSDVIAAIDWAVEHRAQYNLRIINLSLGHPVFEPAVDDPLCQAVQRAVDAGVLVVAAAGNFGKTADGRPIIGGVVSPGNAAAALTVGALNTRGTVQRSDDKMATYSSRGPTMIDGVLKPELVAPGNRIISTSSNRSYFEAEYPERLIEGAGGNGFIEMSGTSMSAAVVSGAAALLLEAGPGLTPREVKLLLQVTSSQVAGAGLIAAVSLLVGAVTLVSAVALISAGS